MGITLPVLLLGFAGIWWVATHVQSAERLDEFRYVKSEMLRAPTDDVERLRRRYARMGTTPLSGCDVDAQSALAVTELRIAEAALAAGMTDNFDRTRQSLRQRIEKSLRCAPHQPLLWMIGASLDAVAGRLDDAQAKLMLSYETGANEGGVASSRNAIALPLAAIVSPSLRQKILVEFETLLAGGFIDQAARSYRRAGADARALVEPYLTALAPERKERFFEALKKLEQPQS